MTGICYVLASLFSVLAILLTVLATGDGVFSLKDYDYAWLGWVIVLIHWGLAFVFWVTIEWELWQLRENKQWTIVMGIMIGLIVTLFLLLGLRHGSFSCQDYPLWCEVLPFLK